MFACRGDRLKPPLKHRLIDGFVTCVTPNLYVHACEDVVELERSISVFSCLSGFQRANSIKAARYPDSTRCAFRRVGGL
jgi:hypothetical protein